MSTADKGSDPQGEDMTDTAAEIDITDSKHESTRLDAFSEEIAKLGVTGGAANPERTGTIVGIVFMAVGAVFAVIFGLFRLSSTDSGDPATLLQEIASGTNNLWWTLAGMTLVLVGLALWIRNSLTRYLRYWLIRLVYEERASADRIVEAIERSGRNSL